jgi:hypothetical protein
MHGVESTAKGVKLNEYKEFHVASGVLGNGSGRRGRWFKSSRPDF